GRALYATDQDSLTTAVGSAPPQIIVDMSRDDWDFSEYPDPNHMDSYLNRVFYAVEIRGPEDVRPLGYLLASYFPMVFVEDELNNDMAALTAQENMFKVVVGLLIYSAITALLIMTRTSRRVKRLSDGVHAIASGDLAHRVPARSADEIGALGRNFNSMAEHLEITMTELQKKQEFQRQLIANVSHDLRTPMASIHGYIETMQMKGSRLDSAEQERYLNIIESNINHLNRLVEHMLVLSRFDSGQAIMRMEDFSIVELVDSLEERLSGLVSNHGVHLNIECERDVGQVRGDPMQIAQVLQNLVENAIKFSDKDGKISVKLKCSGQRVNITVADTGCGISEEDLPHIFDRSFTCNRSRTRSIANSKEGKDIDHLNHSSGLGLAIAAKIIEGHDSILEVESRFGEGSSFSFKLDHLGGTDQESPVKS
ncbi:MAG: signal transduction histidine kinase, partial [Candidatus Krumholzibacteriia bacterium]